MPECSGTSFLNILLIAYCTITQQVEYSSSYTVGYISWNVQAARASVCSSAGPLTRSATANNFVISTLSHRHRFFPTQTDLGTRLRQPDDGTCDGRRFFA